MSFRPPTECWNERKAEERRRLAAGEISEAECHKAQLFPDAFVERTDALLKEFVASTEQCSPSESDFHLIMESIETLVVALNQVNEDFDHSVIETDEREELCEFIDATVAARGVDLDKLAAFHGCGRHELTDQWRDW